MSRDTEKVGQHAQTVLSQFIFLTKNPIYTLPLKNMRKDDLRQCAVIRTLLLQILEAEEMIEFNLGRMLHYIIQHPTQNISQQLNENHRYLFSTRKMEKEIEWVQLLLTKIREKTIKQEYIMIRQAALFLARRTQQLKEAAMMTVETTTATPAFR